MKRLIHFYLIGLLLLILMSCRTMKLAKRLDPASEEFLFIVQYIISDEERKIFLELPPWERGRFVGDFWGRRDPIPSTEVNEFKDLYLNRINEANKLFTKGRKGFLTDRGRIYVLFGQPDEVIKSEGGQTIDPFAQPIDVERPTREGIKPMETWIYRNILSSLQNRIYIRLDFVDVDATGDLKLVTDLREAVPGAMSSLLSPNLTLLHELNKEEFAKKRLVGEKSLFDFNWQFRKVKTEEGNLLVRLEIPLKSVYFTEEDGFLKSTFRLNMQIIDENENVLWELKKDYPFSTSKSAVEESRIESWVLDIPVAYRLSKGVYNAYIQIINLMGKEEAKKLLPFKI